MTAGGNVARRRVAAGTLAALCAAGTLVAIISRHFYHAGSGGLPLSVCVKVRMFVSGRVGLTLHGGSRRGVGGAMDNNGFRGNKTGTDVQ